MFWTVAVLIFSNIGWAILFLLDVPGKIDAANKWRLYIAYRSHGSPEITSHSDKDLVYDRKVKIEGTFKPQLLDNRNRPLLFWLITKEGNRFWPQYPLELGTGKWSCAEVGLWKDDQPDAERFVQIVRISPFVEEVFLYCVEMGKKTGQWPGISLNPSQRDVKVIQQIRLIRVVKSNANQP